MDGAKITAELHAVTEANDAALLTPKRWAEAAANWLLKLVGGDIYLARSTIDRAISDHLNEIEERAKQEAEAMSKNVTVQFPSKKEENVINNDTDGNTAKSRKQAAK